MQKNRIRIKLKSVVLYGFDKNVSINTSSPNICAVGNAINLNHSNIATNSGFSFQFDACYPLHTLDYAYDFDKQTVNFDLQLHINALSRDLALTSELLSHGFNSTFLVYESKFNKDTSNQNISDLIRIQKSLIDIIFDKLLKNLDLCVPEWAESVTISCYEVLDNKIRDLHVSKSEKSYKLRENKDKALLVEGLRSFSSTNISEIYQHLQNALNNRMILVAEQIQPDDSPQLSNKMNLARKIIGTIGNVFIRFTIHHNSPTMDSNGKHSQSLMDGIESINTNYQQSNVDIVILGSSETYNYKIDENEKLEIFQCFELNDPIKAKTKPMNPIASLNKVQLINLLQNGIKNLTMLRRVIHLLQSNQNHHKMATQIQQHIPYRDCLLTRLLQPCLEGNTFMMMITILQTDHQSLSSEVFSNMARTLRFASEIGGMHNYIYPNKHWSGFNKARLVDQFTEAYSQVKENPDMSSEIYQPDASLEYNDDPMSQFAKHFDGFENEMVDVSSNLNNIYDGSNMFELEKILEHLRLKELKNYNHSLVKRSSYSMIQSGYEVDAKPKPSDIMQYVDSPSNQSSIYGKHSVLKVNNDGTASSTKLPMIHNASQNMQSNPSSLFKQDQSQLETIHYPTLSHPVTKKLSVHKIERQNQSNGSLKVNVDWNDEGAIEGFFANDTDDLIMANSLDEINHSNAVTDKSSFKMNKEVAGLVSSIKSKLYSHLSNSQREDSLFLSDQRTTNTNISTNFASSEDCREGNILDSEPIESEILNSKVSDTIIYVSIEKSVKPIPVSLDLEQESSLFAYSSDNLSHKNLITSEVDSNLCNVSTMHSATCIDHQDDSPSYSREEDSSKNHQSDFPFPNSYLLTAMEFTQDVSRIFNSTQSPASIFDHTIIEDETNPRLKVLAVQSPRNVSFANKHSKVEKNKKNDNKSMKNIRKKNESRSTSATVAKKPLAARNSIALKSLDSKIESKSIGIKSLGSTSIETDSANDAKQQPSLAVLEEELTYNQATDTRSDGTDEEFTVDEVLLEKDASSKDNSHSDGEILINPTDNLLNSSSSIVEEANLNSLNAVESQDNEIEDILTDEEKDYLKYVARGQVELAKECIEDGVDPLVKNQFHRDALQIATRNGSLSMLQMLFKTCGLGALLTSRSQAGDTLIHLAGYYGHLEVMKWLIKIGLFKSAINNLGQTVVHLVAFRADLMMLQYLAHNLELDFNLYDKCGRSPLECIPNRRGADEYRYEICRNFVREIICLQEPE